jgi:hypothetical protein
MRFTSTLEGMFMVAAKIIVMTPELRKAFLKVYWPVGTFEYEHCCKWLGSIDAKSGYGRLYHDHVHYQAHRLSFMIFNQLETFAFDALHDCDRRWCVNPNHLFAGTNADNVADKIAKDRHSKIYTADQIREARERLKRETQKQVAFEMGMSPTTVWRIAKGLTRKEVV